jgi:hypothetical protein
MDRPTTIRGAGFPGLSAAFVFGAMWSPTARSSASHSTPPPGESYHSFNVDVETR